MQTPPTPLRRPRILAGAGLVMALVLSAGCGSVPPRDKLDGPPGKTYQSARTPAAYAQCVTPRWRAITVVSGAPVVETVPGANGSLRMTLKVDGAISRVLEVLPEGRGATVRYWNNSIDLGSGTPTSVKAIEECLV